MVRNGNEIAPIPKMLEKMQTRTDESDRKIQLMATTFQTLIKSAQKKKVTNLTMEGGT